MKTRYKNIFKNSFIILGFFILFLINYTSLFGWIFLLLGVIEDTTFDFLPSDETGIAVFNIIHILFAIILSGVAVYIYRKTQNKVSFWIIYLLFTFSLFLLTSYIFSDFVV